MLVGAGIYAALFALIAWGVWRSGECEDDE
jgi:hypothetical protein